MRMQSQGMAMNDYLKMMGMTPEMMRASAKPSALRQVQLELALDAVAAAENMEITEEDCAKEITKLAEQYNITEDQVKAALSMDMLKHDLRLQKANDFVVAHWRFSHPHTCGGVSFSSFPSQKYHSQKSQRT